MTFTELSKLNAIANQAKERVDRLKRQAETVSSLRRKEPSASLRAPGQHQESLGTISNSAPLGRTEACEIFAEVWQDACPDILRAVELRLLSEAKRELVRYRALQRQVANSIVTERVEDEPVIES